MARKPKSVEVSNEPKVIRGSHSTRTEYPDGRVEFVTHWDELVKDVQTALASISTNLVEATETKVKKTRKKKTTV